MSAHPHAVTHQRGDRLAFHCPGCQSVHEVVIAGDRRWDWNNSREQPTFRPSVRVREFLGETVTRTCHSYVTNGVIEFLGDCTHDLAGQRRVLQPFPYPYLTPDAGPAR